MPTETQLTPLVLDCTPTWTGILASLVVLLDSHNRIARSTALEELNTMAHLADLYVAEHKPKNETPKGD